MAYLNGYPDGTFRPDRNMTRAEAAQLFYNLLLAKDVAATVSFDDVDSSAWYAGAVDTLASLGIINGVGDGKFEPERSITRAEFTAIAMRFADRSPCSATSTAATCSPSRTPRTCTRRSRTASARPLPAAAMSSPRATPSRPPRAPKTCRP